LLLLLLLAAAALPTLLRQSVVDRMLPEKKELISKGFRQELV